MYEAFFGLRQKPFALQPDCDFVFDAQGYTEALRILEHALTAQAELTVITGETGCGKTMLVHGLLRQVGDDISVGLIANTNPSFSSIAPWALISFDQKPIAGAPGELQQQLMLHLIAEYGSGRRCLLVIDEAQNLAVPLLEELNLVMALNEGDEPLLQVVLVGQPELLDRLNDSRLGRFTDRIAFVHKMQRLAASETGPYVRHRLATAGSVEPIFTETATRALHVFSGGTPWLINMLADLAMVYAFANDQRVVDLDLIQRVVSDRQASGITPFTDLDRPEIVEASKEAPLPEKDSIPASMDPGQPDADLIFPMEDVDPRDLALEQEKAPASAQLFAELLAAHRSPAGREAPGHPITPENSAHATARMSLRRRFLPRDENNG